MKAKLIGTLKFKIRLFMYNLRNGKLKPKFECIPNLATAIPRLSKFGVLIFNHGFFIFDSKSIGIEITIASKRYEGEEGCRIVWFRIKRWDRICKEETESV